MYRDMVSNNIREKKPQNVQMKKARFRREKQKSANDTLTKYGLSLVNLIFYIYVLKLEKKKQISRSNKSELENVFLRKRRSRTINLIKVTNDGGLYSGNASRKSCSFS